MVKTIYGKVENKDIYDNFNFMIGKVFKIIYLKEEDCKTLDIYIKSLSRKFIGISKMYYRKESLSIVNILNGIELDDHKTLRSDVFEIIDVINIIKMDIQQC